MVEVESQSGVCGECSMAYECGKLHLALTMIKASSSGRARLERIHRSFVDQLATYGFDYPVGLLGRCSLSDDPELLRSIVDEACEIARDVAKRQDTLRCVG